jgi:hypothetical protein
MTPSEEYDRVELRSVLTDTLRAQLTETQIRIVIAHVVDEKPLDRIAYANHISPVACRNLYSSARRAMERCRPVLAQFASQSSIESTEREKRARFARMAHWSPVYRGPRSDRRD